MRIVARTGRSGSSVLKCQLDKLSIICDPRYVVRSTSKGIQELDLQNFNTKVSYIENK